MLTTIHLVQVETIMHSDLIVLVDEGRIVESDSPENLLSRPSQFKDLFDLRPSDGSPTS